MSSLAAQLQNIASIDASRLTSKTGAPTGKSYLFPPKTAASHDFDAIFSLAQSGYEELLELDPAFEEFEDSLFSEHARRTDRTQLNEAENKELDIVLERCLRRLGRWIGIMAGGKCIEWLVRRFRVHEMNAEVVLQVFLPYHQSPNFPRMLSILTIPNTSRYFAPFDPLIKNAQPLPRSYITQSVSPSRDKSLRLLMDVAGMVQVALSENVVHRGLLAFWSATMVELIESERAGKGVGEGLVKVLVEAFVGILETSKGGQDVNAAVYPPLILLARSVRLADGPFLALLSALLTPSSGAEPSQRILTLLFLLNDRPDWTGGLGEKACARLCKIKRLSTILLGAMEKYGFAPAIPVVVDALLDDVLSSTPILNSLVTYRSVQPELVANIASRLLEIGSDASSSEETIAASKGLLTTLVERHPAQVDQARLARVAAGHQTLDTLVDENTSSMAFVNAYSADAAARIRSIPPLLQTIGISIDDDSDIAMDDKVEDRQSAIEKIRILLGDDDQAVIEALYSHLAQQASEFLNAIGPATYIESVVSQFDSVKPVPAVRIQHLRFIAALDHSNLSQADSVAAFVSLIFPSLLASANRPCFSQAEWAMLEEGSLFKKHELTSSSEFKKAITHAKSTNTGLKQEGIASNTILMKAVAASIISSKTLAHYQAPLVECLHNTIPSTRLMAHLVIGRLLETLPGAQGLELGVAVSPTLDESRKSPLHDVENPEEPLSETYLRAIYTKIDEPRTQARATVSLFASFCKLSRPDSTSVNWFSKSSQTSLYTTLYRHANSDALPPSLAKTLLRSLLGSLREDALVFFASVWTDAKQTTGLQIAALRHATAFVKSYSLGTDFQMVLPSILVAFTASSRGIREAAVALLKVVNRSASDETKTYYAIDTFYGQSTSKVQLLKHGDLVRYLQAIIPALDEVAVDATRLAALHSSALSMNHGRGRKETGHRRSVIGSLFSHISAIPSFVTRMALLQTLVNVHDVSILRGALPLLTPLPDDESDESQWLASRSDLERDVYLQLVFGSFTAQSVALLSDKESDAGTFVRRLLNGNVQSTVASRLRELLLERLAVDVFGALPSEAKVAYFGLIVQGLHNAEDSTQSIAVKAALKRFELDVTSLILVTDDLSKPLHDTSAQPKKQRQDGSQSLGKAEQSVADLTVLLESRDWKSIPGDAPLVAALMSVLSALLAKRQHIKEGVDYLEQEILGAILTLVEKIQNTEEIQKAHIGVEVIIKVIRASSNPRTSQRALLVASELARLIPDAVLHNIMPIFTFMSASDLQRDDAYSFGVVEKTVSRIVPVMTRSLRDKAQTKLELYNESLTFISIFTDMAGRLPRHRTMPFFRHLTHSLGPSDFLAPVCMLLIDRTVTKAGRSAGLTLDLPIGVVGSYDVSIRMEVVLEIVQELARLVADTSNSQKTAFLSGMLGDQGDVERSLRQISSLLRFVAAITAQLAGRPCDQSQVEVLVQQLILLSSAVKSASLDQTEVGQLVYSATGGAMQLLSAENFLAIIARLLASEGVQDVKVALEIFVDRLPLIKTPVRSKCAASMGTIVEKTAGLLDTQPSLVTDALAALRAVAATAVSSEDPALSKAVPKIVQVVKSAPSDSTTMAAMSLLELSARHLSHRLIPHAQVIITTLLSAAQSATIVSSQAFTTISAVIEAIPTFLSPTQLISILRASIEQRAENDTSTKLVTTTAKKVPTKTLFPVVMDLWKDIQNADASAMEGFFHLLRVTLRHADKQNLPTMVKPIFAFFLNVFDLRHRLQKRDFDQAVINEIEESAITSFLELVVRLNEVTFKPLFIRLYDWAVIDLSEGASVDNARLVERKLVLLHVMMGLLQKFRHLLSPYIGILLPHIEELLPAYASGSIEDEALWTLLLEVLAKSYEVDDGAFWTDQHHLKMIPLLTAQLPLFPNAPTPVALAFAALAGSTTSTPVLKALNTSLCLATRSDESVVRMVALKCIDGVWEKQPDEMIQFVPETVSEFLSELLEDENSDVANMARKVLARIEGLTGSLKEYLE